MTEVVSIKFRNRGKTYFFDPAGTEVSAGQKVIVETSKGLEIGDCVVGNHMVQDEKVVPPLRPVVRPATDDDLRVAEINRKREEDAYRIGLEKIAAHGLDMKLVDVECNFEGSKILFFFTSDGRVDFRELVKDLASVFRTRIELRQIGVRDEAKMLGGLGICGRPFCCSQFLDEFQPVSTKMAKTQSISLNPAKISGTCGRLMCCLRYEQEAYEDLVKHVPKNGAFVQTPDGYGNVAQVNLLRQKVKVKLDGSGETVFHTFDVDEIAEVPGGRPKPGDPLPVVLQPRQTIREPEPEEADFWKMPDLLGDVPPAAEPETPDLSESEERARRSGRRRRSRNKAQGQPPKPPVVNKAPAPPSAKQAPVVKRPGTLRPGPIKPKVQQKAPAPVKPKQPAPPKPAVPGEAPAKKRNNRPKRYGKPKPKPES